MSKKIQKVIPASKNNRPSTSKGVYVSIGALCVALSLAGTVVYKKPLPIKQQNPSDISIILYENGRALVSEKKEMTLKKGIQNIFFGEMPQQLILPSATVSGNDIVLQSVNFNPADQAQSYFTRAQTQAIGQPVTLMWEVWKNGTKKEITKKAQLLASEGREPILLVDGKVQKGTDAKILYPKPQKEQNTKPELTFTVLSKTNAPQQVNFSYMASGFEWNAFYNLYMDEVKNVMDIQGQVNLKNNSGVDYKNVNLDFVLGDIHTLNYYTPQKPQTACEINNESGIHVASDQLVVNGKVYRPNENHNQQEFYAEDSEMYMYEKKAMMVSGIAQDNIYDLKDFYVYHLPFQVQLGNNAPTMATFLSAKDVPYEKEYVFTDLISLSNSNQSKNITPALYLTFDTKVLNMPLPQGDFRVFNKHDTQLFFVGESRVKTITMPNQQARVNLGQAMDIYADTQLVDFRELSDTEKLYTYEVNIRNLATQSKNVTVKQGLKIDYYTLKDSSLKPTLSTPSLLEWTFVLPSEQNQTIRFTVIYRNADLIRKRQEKEFDDELCKNKIYGLKTGNTERTKTVYLQVAEAAEVDDEQEDDDE